ncbi:MAG: hypothetical protein JWP35_3628 [Caulobacter sp.]|nr:hypothetical protein [Caulobacter sp.]
MEHKQNIAVLKAALGLAGKEAAVLCALLGGMAYAADLEAACGVASRGALRKHMTRLREKLPRGGITSRRRPTRYWLTQAAVEGCLRALGAVGRQKDIVHEPHEPHERAVGGIGGLRSLYNAPSARFLSQSASENAMAARPPGPVRVVRVVRGQILATSNNTPTPQEARK